MTDWFKNESGLFAKGDVPILSSEPDPSKYEMRNGLLQPKLPEGGFSINLTGLIPSYSSFLGSGLSFGFTATTTKKKPKPDEIDMTRTEPFVGWKTLTLKVTKRGNLRFVGNGKQKYEVDATAKCNHGKPHAAPDWDCTCGFYALSERPTHAELGWFMANVELFGTVIEGEHGWRASRQRVLSMEVFRECQAADGNCGDPASGFQVARGGKVWPVCAPHAPLGFATLADLTAQLGTEVRWREAA